MAHQVASYRAAGMDGHLAKPIEIARLFEVVQAAAATEAVSDRPIVRRGGALTVSSGRDCPASR